MCKPWVMAADIDFLPRGACSIAASLELVGERWSLLVIREVAWGNHRFSDIVRGTGAPRDRLAARLSALVAAGVLEKRPYSDSPPRSGYHLTAAGRDLLPVLQALLQWGDRWARDEPAVRLSHAPGGTAEHPIDAEWVCRTCGRPVMESRVSRELTPAGRALAGLPITEEHAHEH
ncbi:transcriptional regulator, HxlR family [Trujillonella endophytica]|uniref:Transcriptional regulator, HxlR family n=2 Tax=Trujillonella endophytica TaxID=673521 RepID=A0A1H8SES5_9ACTN|nr:transcriptional regulator, HxlR family [Trujillella endophytica]